MTFKEMDDPFKIASETIDESFLLLQNDEVNDAVSSTFYGSAREKLDRESLDKIVKVRADSFAGTSLARTISAVGAGKIFKGSVSLYKPFFGEFNIEIGPGETGASLGLSMKTRRVIVLLHELSHLTRKYIDIYQVLGLNYFDEAIYDKCTINKRIYDACYSKTGK